LKTVKLALVLAFLAALFLPGIALAQTDPGVQSGPARAGLPLASVNSSDGTLQFFQNGQARFQGIESVSNSPNGNNGLGPRFNFVQCAGCRTRPAVGGTGPANNPQFPVIANGFVSGSTNTIPSFITSSGPTPEARFPFFFDAHGNPDPNAPNGGGRGPLHCLRPFRCRQLQPAAAQLGPGAADQQHHLSHSAIEAHESNGSEATQAELNFNSLSASQQQDSLNFIRSL
jgi:hypothetical protein